MKEVIIFLIGFVLITGCAEKEKSENNQYSVAIKEVAEFKNGEKLHYREFDSKENELLHIYFNDEVEEKTISKYDTFGLKLVEIEYQNDSLIREIKYEYEFDNEKRPLKITTKADSTIRSRLLRYKDKNDTLVTVHYQSEKDFKDGKWLRKSFTDGIDKLYRIEYNEIYSGRGEKIIYHFSEVNLIDYKVHFYMGYDTTFYKYNHNNKVVRTARRSRGRQNYSDFEYDANDNRTRWIITEMTYYQGDTLVSDWNYKWKNIKK